MRITCDSSVRMGYIYLMPNETTDTLEKSDVGLYYDVNTLSIPRIKWLGLGKIFGHMRLSNKTYGESVDNAFVCEYWNDLDSDGYMVGIELNFPEELFLSLVANQAFKLYDTIWRDKDFRVATLAAHHDVIDKNNIIYPLTAEKDAFVVVSTDPTSKVGKIMALITSRDDLYPIDYLRKPLFMLANSNRSFQ